MPKVFEYDGFKYFFFSNEGSPLEPIHIHVRKSEKTAKFWLEPEILLDKSYKMSSNDLRKILDVIIQNQDLIREKWNAYFNR